MKKITIVVTLAEIEIARFECKSFGVDRTCKCPVALALKAASGARFVTAGYDSLWFYNETINDRMEADTPADVKARMICFDRTQEMQPFAFELEFVRAGALA